MAKMNFALAGEVIHDHNFYFLQHSLLEHDDLISCKYIVTFYNDFK